MANLLIELGTEEMPLSSLDVIYGELPAKTSAALSKFRISYGQVKVEATPRRVALFVEGISKRQTDETGEVSGPSFEKAYDEKGSPTKALQGFLKSKNASVKDVKIKESPKGKFVYLIKTDTGQPLTKIMPDLLAAIFSSLSFVKQMRWEATGFRFPRPIRWLLVMLDQKTLPVRFSGMKSGSLTFGHRFLSRKPVQVKKAQWGGYEKTLKNSHVILNLKKREEIIRKALLNRFDQTSIDEELVHMNAQMVEEPFLLKGKFSKTYLDLPQEVLSSCMKKNQKIFACYDTKGRVTGHFVAVLNGKRSGLGKIRADFENVLESRLKDAQFFYREDTKTGLEDKVEKLKEIVYLGKLGTLHDKAERMARLADAFGDALGRHDLVENLKRAARLAKADLTTHLVYEFPDLQGIAGREYAYSSGEKKEIAEAIGTQYLPKNLAEEISVIKKTITPVGAVLGMMDRLDLLVGAFAIDLEPTGSQDPFALRRAGGVFIKLVRAFGFHFSLESIIHAAVDAYGNTVKVQKKDMERQLKEFLKDRVAFELKVQTGTRDYEILRAVLKTTFDDLADVFNRYEILKKCFRDTPEVFLKTAKVVERTSNILKGVQDKKFGKIRSELFQEALEKRLFQVIENKSGEIENAVRSRDYDKATVIFGESFYGPLHDFFDKILVNAEDQEVRLNRQAMMKKINSLYADSVADLSVLSRIDIE